MTLGKVVTVFAAKSGYGKTTVATNLAVVLGEYARRVCLVDLDVVFGGVSDVLALGPGRAVQHTGVPTGRLTVGDVSLLVTPYRTGLDCVPAPAEPGDTERVSPSFTTELLAVLSSAYDYVVVDTPAQFSSHVLCALDLSQFHVLVATPERPALRNLRRTLDILDMLHYRHESRAIVLNRCDPWVDLTDAEVDLVVKNPVAARLPFTFDVPMSINQRTPLAISAPEHPFTTAIHRFTSTYVARARPG